MSKINYNSFPLGKLPKEFERPELELIKKNGYSWNDPRNVIDIFEKKLATFAGSKYCVLTDCCSHGIFLSLKYLKKEDTIIKIPKHTYASVPMQIKYAGYDFEFTDENWSGIYQLGPLPVYDAAVRFTKNMYIPGSLFVTSFQIKKRLPIGRGGAIFTDSKDAYDWLKLASYDGRNLDTPYDNEAHISMLGYHMYMTPEDAARGILLMDQLPEENKDSASWENYPDLTKFLIFKDK